MNRFFYGISVLILFLFSRQAAAATADTVYTSRGNFTVRQNSSIILKGRYKHHVPTGFWNYYDALGKPVKTERYKRGEIQFTYVYNEDGVPYEKILRDGRRVKLKTCKC